MGKRAMLLVALALPGCSEPIEPDTRLEGLWTYASEVSGEALGVGINCQYANVTMELTQDGRIFSGTTSEGTVFCVVGGVPTGEPAPLRQFVVIGQVDRNDVVFDFDTPNWRHLGRIANSAMSGIVSERMNLGPPYGTVILTGDWSAIKR